MIIYANSLSMSHYSIKILKGQTFYARISANNKTKIYSDDTNVATVTRKGYIYGVNVGVTNINAENEDGNKVSCEVTVLEEPPARFLYSQPNIAHANSSIECIAITDQSKEQVKFEVFTPGAPKTVYAYNKEREGRTYVWKARVNVPGKGKFRLRVHSRTSTGQWRMDPANDSFIVVSDNNRNSCDGSRLSDKGVEFIACCEGFVPMVYEDRLANNIPTIGYGKTLKVGDTFYNNLTRREGYAMLLKTVNESIYTQSISNFLHQNNIKFNQNQFDALVSFTYNVGTAWISNSRLRNLFLSAVKDSNIVNANVIGRIKSTDGVNVRMEPSTSSEIITTLCKNSTVSILSKDALDSDWYKVRLSNGKIGFVFSEYIDLTIHYPGEKHLNYVDKNKFIKELSEYHHAGGICYDGLLKRRYKELDIFFHGIYMLTPGEYNNKHGYPTPKCRK